MYITCKQCSTIFRLDESRIKPEGSKVRCSQCSRVFVAYPPVAGRPVQPADVDAAAAAPPSPPQDSFDRELDGIDLAELDSIMEQDRLETAAGAYGAGQGGAADLGAAEAHELDESDLELDFEAALDLGEEAPAAAPAEAPEQAEEALDLNMDFELDSEAPAAAAAQASESSELKADELEMDFELVETGDQPLEDREQGGAGESDTEIDLALDDFKDALDEVDQPVGLDAAAGADVDEELSLDMDIDLEQQAEPEAAIEEVPAAAADDMPAESRKEKPEIAADDLGLGDLEDILQQEPTTPDIETEDEELELSLDEDVDLSLDEEPAFELESKQPAETGFDDASAAKAASDDFDLGDLDDLLEADEGQERAPAADEELELTLDDAGPETEESPIFALEEEEGADQGAGASEDTADDFDLGGFDALLEEVDAVTQQASEPGNEELELDVEPAPETATGGIPSEGTGEALEELEFELDAEFEDKPIAKKAAEDHGQMAVEEEEELDLSDIEKMLEDDSFVPEPVAPVADADSDLTAGAEKWAEDAPADDLGLGSDGEIDLSDIEAAIDAADEEVDTGADADEELHLDLDQADEASQQDEELDFKLEMERDSAAPGDELMQDGTEEIDLSDLDLSIEEDKPEVESEVIDAGDMELEFQIEQEPQKVEPLAAEAAETLVTGQTTAGFGKTSTGAGLAKESDEALIQEAFAAPPPEAKVEPKRRAPAPKKKGGGKLLIIILVLALLGGGGYYGYDYVIQNNIQIPYLSDFINPQPKDPNHIAKLSTLEINSKFIENTGAGRLFVVTGKVRNGDTLPCKLIQLQGKLFTKGKVLAKTEHIYAGMIISDQELTSLPLAQIKQRLETASGQVGTIVANPGQSLPFMVVFSDLPADLDEFAVELMSSTQVR